MTTMESQSTTRQSLNEEVKMDKRDEDERPELETKHSDVDDEEVAGSHPQPAATAGPPSLTGPIDQGWLCWLQVVGAFATWVNSFGLANSFGEFQTYYEGVLPNSSSQIAWIGSIQSWLVLFVSVLAGPAFDAGYFRQLLYLGNFLVVFGMMMTSLCTQYWQIILAQGIVVGVGSGCLLLPGVAIIPQYFVRRRVFATGISAVGSGFGGVVYPIVLHRLLPQVGFGWTVRIIGFISLVFGVVSLLTLRNKLPPRKMRSLVAPGFFKDVPLVIYTLGMFFNNAALYIPVFYIGSYSLHFGITDSNLAFYLVPILQAANIFGRIGPAFIADRTGPVTMTIPAMLFACAMAFAWIGIRSEASLLVFAILYGIFFGIIQSMPPSCVVSLSTDLSLAGSNIGNCFGIAGLGVLIGTPLAGLILGEANNFVALQAFTGALIAAGCICAFASRTVKVGLTVTKV